MLIKLFNLRFIILIVLILDISHNFLNKVLHGYDTAEASIFINQNGDMLMLALHLPKQIVNVFAFQHKERLAQNARYIHVLETVFPCLDYKILDVQDADDIVDGIPVNRNTAVAHFHQLIQIFTLRIINIDTEYIRSRSHHLFCQNIVEGEYAVDHISFILIEDTALLPAFHHGTNFLTGKRFFNIFILHAEQTEYKPC